MLEMPSYQRASSNRMTNVGLMALAISIVVGMAFSQSSTFALVAGIAGLALVGLTYLANW